MKYEKWKWKKKNDYERKERSINITNEKEEWSELRKMAAQKSFNKINLD